MLFGDGDAAQRVKHLRSMNKVLGSIPSICKLAQRSMTAIPALRQTHYQQFKSSSVTEFKTNLRYMRSYLKINLNKAGQELLVPQEYRLMLKGSYASINAQVSSACTASAYHTIIGLKQQGQETIDRPKPTVSTISQDKPLRYFVTMAQSQLTQHQDLEGRKWGSEKGNTKSQSLSIFKGSFILLIADFIIVDHNSESLD